MISIRPRWRKVFFDIWENKVRSLLVVASIAIGLFALGMIGSAYVMISEDMRASYTSSSPANILMYTYPFDDELVKAVRRLPGVADAQGGRSLSLRLHTGEQKWIVFNLHTLNFNDQRLNRVKYISGAAAPSDHEVVVDQNALDEIGAREGDWLQVELPDGSLRELRLVGVVHDSTIGSMTGDFFTAPAQGYVTLDTMHWLGQPDTFDQLYVSAAGNTLDEEILRSVSSAVKAHIERGGRQVFNTRLRVSQHPANDYVQAIIGVMGLLGLLVVFLSGFLISNTLSALLNQHIKQIGIMKAVGARRSQIVGMYLVFILIFSVLALLVSVPTSSQAAYWLVEMVSHRINFQVQGFRLIPAIVLLQSLIALVVPQVAGVIPAMRGASVTVQQAINATAASAGKRRSGGLGALVNNLRGFSRPLLISLRNTFRRRSRLILTLITLTLGGAIFIATFNVRASLDSYINRIHNYFGADVTVIFDRNYRVEEIQQVVEQVPGVARIESWATPRAELVLDGVKTEDTVQIFSPPEGSQLVKPVLIQGRWLVPGDRNAITINEAFLRKYPGLSPGSSLRLKIEGRESDWVVVGVFQFVGGSNLIAYTNYEYTTQLMGRLGQSSSYRVVASGAKQTLESQKALGQTLDARLRQLGFRVNEISTGISLMRSASDGLNILIGVLLVLAMLTALVGSIGLMGMMSMNVMERTREIGVMRAIGASDRKIMNLVIVEGLVIGLISWFVGSLLAFPISFQLATIVSQAIFKAPANFALTANGFIIWLAAVIVLSMLASVLPARNAARLTIREVLAYE